MNLAAVYHRTSDNYCYPLDENALIINLRTGEDVDRVQLCYGDPFEQGILGGKEQWTGEIEELIYKKKLPQHTWWTTTIRPRYKRCRYYFRLYSEKECFYYYEDAFCRPDEVEGKNFQYFTFPWMNPADINRVPDWVRETVWYQIFPDRFSNGETGNDLKGTKPWGYHSVRNEESYGGDLQGITDRLPYLADLGINGIYLTPVFEADSIHKYNITDYTRIDPQFGDDASMALLVRKAHEQGIRVMLDGVFNHCGIWFAPWQDVLDKGKASSYFSWFMINEWPIDREAKSTRDGTFYSFAFAAGMPKLNTNHPEVIEYFTGVVAQWIRRYDIDGLRLDVANEVSHRFLRNLRETVKTMKPDFYLLGEIWHDSIRWLGGDEFDGVMNYPLMGTIGDFWSMPKSTADQLERSLNRVFTLYMQQTNNCLFNLLDSHDTDRIRSRVTSVAMSYQQLALLFVLPGSPCIYYGTELGMEGGHDPDCRRCMPWSWLEEGRGEETRQLVRRLIHLRRTYSALRSPHYHFVGHEEDRLVHLIKTDEGGEQIELLLNAAKTAFPIPEETGFCLFSYKADGGAIEPEGIYLRKL